MPERSHSDQPTVDSPAPLPSMPSILITGGAGFIGVNAAQHFASLGWEVVVLDNLSRRGTEDNLQWLLAQHPGIDFHRVDIRQSDALADVVGSVRPSMLLHLAAQVAVTTSYTNPREDFEINALGSFNVMEAVRLRSPESFVLFASTNKVYGGMETVPVEMTPHGYRFRDLPGRSERAPAPRLPFPLRLLQGGR